MAGHDFSNWLDREMPQPIYAQEGRLLDVIRKGVQAKINQANGKKDGEIQTTIADMERTNDGGVVLIVRAEIDADEKGFKKLQDWKITTDRWGGIRKMSQAGPLRYVKGPVRDDSKDDRGDKKGDDDQKISPDTNSEPPWQPNYHR
jgi:hypothetical protein